MSDDDSAAALHPGPPARVGRHDVPEDWPVSGEARQTFRQKLRNGFFSTYFSGDVILDIGYRGYGDNPAPILPHAIGIDLDYPGYDGTVLPFADASVDTVYSSHTLEHIPDYRAAIRDWHRVLRVGGYIVCVVPHQFLYEKKSGPPSFWNPDHRRFYTPASLLCEFEEALAPNTYRVRHLRDCDDGYTYDAGPETHPGGCYEIELVVQKIEKPGWNLSGDDGSSDARLAIRELARIREERDRLASASMRWFDAAVTAVADRLLTPRRPSLRQRLAWLGGGQTSSALVRARCAAGAGQWERAARFYVDALSQTPGASAIWSELGHALKQAGNDVAAEFARRRAGELAARSLRNRR